MKSRPLCEEQLLEEMVPERLHALVASFYRMATDIHQCLETQSLFIQKIDLLKYRLSCIIS